MARPVLKTKGSITQRSSYTYIYTVMLLSQCERTATYIKRILYTEDYIIGKEYTDNTIVILNWCHEHTLDHHASSAKTSTLYYRYRKQYLGHGKQYLQYVHTCM